MIQQEIIHMPEKMKMHQSFSKETEDKVKPNENLRIEKYNIKQKYKGQAQQQNGGKREESVNNSNFPI